MGATGASLLLLGRERWAARDPAGALMGAGALGVGGVIAGAIAAATLGDFPGHPDRIRPAELEGRLTLDETAVSQERHPPTGMVRWAPTYYFGDGSRVRLIGGAGGVLGQVEEVDPRPQQGGAYDVGLVERRIAVDLGLDLAVALPYPILSPRRSHHLGPVELRYRPEVAIRRHIFQPGTDQARVLERTMLLPLTVGFRWHVSPRQRFTFYLGPRFDFIAYSDQVDDGLSRGRPVIGPVHGAAWYDIDVPFDLLMPQRLRRVELNGMLRLGYVHSRFEGRGFNLGGAIGFAGPFQAEWTMRVRGRGAQYAAQAAVGAWVGNGVAPYISLGVVFPRWKGASRDSRRAVP